MLAIATAPHPDENAPGVNPAVAAQRKLRRLRGELERTLGEPVLTALTSAGGTTLIPHRTDEGWDRLRDLVRAAERAAGVDVTAAAVLAHPGRHR